MKETSPPLCPPITVYSSGSTLPCGSAQRDTRLSLPPISLSRKSRLFGMGRHPLHARIIVNSKAAQKPTFYLAFPPALLSRSDRPALTGPASPAGYACMFLLGIVARTAVSWYKGFANSPRRLRGRMLITTPRPLASFCELTHAYRRRDCLSCVRSDYERRSGELFSGVNRQVYVRCGA